MGMLKTFLSKVDELVRIVKTGWGFDDIELSDPNPTHVISNVWQRTVSVLQGWDYASKQRRLVSIDEFGRLGVSFTPTIGIPANIYRFTVTTTPNLVAQENLNRSYLIVKNVGLFDIFIGNNNAVTSTTGYLLSPMEEIVLDKWNVALWAVTGGSNSTLAVIER